MPVKYLQTSFNAGVLNPLLAGRMDLRQFYQGMKVGRNVLTRPQGTVRRRPGTKYLETLAALIRRRFENITATAPNGGTANNAKDNNTATVVLTTTNVGVLDPYVVVHYDLANAQTVTFVDALGLKLSADASTDEFEIQYSTDNAAWTRLGEALQVVDDGERNYRRRGPVTARYFRLVKIGGSNLGTVKVSLQEFSIWQETTDYLGSGDYTPDASDVRLVPFQFNTEQEYLLAFTDYNCAVFHAGGRVADVPTPYAGDELAALDYAQKGDTVILVHEDHAPRKLQRNETSELWTLSPITFTNIPQVDYADADSPTATAAVQDLQFNFDLAGVGGFALGSASGWASALNSPWVDGDTFKIDVNGALTREIRYAGSSNATEKDSTAENIRKAVQEVWTVGFTGVTVTTPGGGLANAYTYRITLAEDSADVYPLFIGVPVETKKQASTLKFENIVTGVSRKEDAWSAARGYPRSVTFFEGRLFFGGLKSLPTTVVGSVVSDPFNFELGEGLDGDACMYTLDTDQLNAIVQVTAGPSLLVFTTGAEFYYPRGEGEPITPSGAGFKVTTEYGAGQIPPVKIDGAVMFAQKTRKVLRDFSYDTGTAAYVAPPLTVMAGHLVHGIVDMAGWSGDTDDETNLVFLVNDDGTVAVFNTLQSQEVNAWVEWVTRLPWTVETEGKRQVVTIPDADDHDVVKAVGVVDESIYFAVLRDINGVQRLFLEQLTESYYMDAAVTGTNLSPSSTLDGLDHLEGCAVWARADGFYMDPATVTGGEITATIGGEPYLATSFEVGLAWIPQLETMPLNVQIQDGDTMLRKKRIVKAKGLLKDSLGVRVNGILLEDQKWDQDDFDEAPEPHTGTFNLGDTTGWTQDPLTLTIDQLTPHPFELLMLDVELEIGGN